MKYIKILLLVCAVIWLSSCTEENDPTNPSSQVSIISVSPGQGNIGDVITITGNNFSNIKSSNQVFFAGVIAYPDEVILGNPMKLQVRVPQGAMSGFITVKTGGKEAQSPSQFTVLNEMIGNLYPFSSGTYWVYNYFMLDSSDNRVQGSNLKDSLFISGTSSFFGKESFIIQKYSTNTETSQYEKKDDQYFYTEDNKLYTHPNFFVDLLNLSGSAIQLPFTMDEKWYKISDRTQSEWDIFAKLFSNEPMTFGATEGTVSGNLTIKGTNDWTEHITVPAKSGNSFKFRMKIKFDGKVSVPSIGMNNLDLKLDREVEFYYMAEIGRVKMKMKAMKLLIPNVVDSNIPGFETELLTYLIK
jgi:hypothetical protein